jgi:Zn-dependent protease
MSQETLQQIALLIVPVIIAITFHEAAHGFVAFYCGDRTAKDLGRVTLNPLKHIDLFGTVIMPLVLILSAGFMFGYAKPVPVDFRALRNPRRDMMLVAAAGPLMNIALAISFAVLLRVYLSVAPEPEEFYANLFIRSVSFNVMLAVFNLIPLPPLDGSKVVAPLLPWSIARPYLKLERYGMVILLLVMFVLPIVLERNGSDFDIMGWLVVRPSMVVTNFILNMTGG